MILIYNDKTLIPALLDVACGLGMGSFMQQVPPGLLVGGAVTALVDFVGRLKEGEGGAALVHPRAGGHLYFIPVWLIGIALAVSGFLGWSGLVR